MRLSRRRARRRCPEQPAYRATGLDPRAARSSRERRPRRRPRRALGEEVLALGPLPGPLRFRAPAPRRATPPRYRAVRRGHRAAVPDCGGGAAVRRPEDVHWADEASLALLEFAAQDRRAQPLLITYRDQALGAAARARRGGAASGSGSCWCGLNRVAVERFIVEFAGERVAAELSAERPPTRTAATCSSSSRQRCALQQEGLTRRCRARAAAAARHRARLDPPPPRADPGADRELLSIAAVAGDDADVRLAGVVGGIDPATALEQWLNAAVERGFRRRARRGPLPLRARAGARDDLWRPVLHDARAPARARRRGRWR